MEDPAPYVATLLRLGSSTGTPPMDVPPADLSSAGHGIDWGHLLMRRRAVLDHTHLPPYLESSQKTDFRVR